MSNNQEPFDLNNVEFKMPEENFLNAASTEPTSRKLPIILIGIIVLLLLILGGLIWWGLELVKQPIQPVETIPTVTRPTPEENKEPETPNAEADVSVIQTLSSSTDWPDVNADIDATNFDNLTSELVTIDNLINEKSQ